MPFSGSSSFSSFYSVPINCPKHINGVILMSWLCDICGYENEFSDEVQITTCLCCGESASEDKIVAARRDLEASHREAERKAQLEKLRQRKALRRERLECIATLVIRITKILPATTAALIMLSLVLTGISAHLENDTLTSWSRQMQSNSLWLQFEEYPSIFHTNIAEIGLHEKLFDTHFSSLSDKLMENKEEEKDIFIHNTKIWSNSVFEQIKSLSRHTLLIGDKMLGNFRENVEPPMDSPNAAQPSSNIKNNWQILLDQAKSNVQGLIDTFSIR